jgi:predicted O-linked N-acetylglucosamine transferase (SPINDLY family)
LLTFARKPAPVQVTWLAYPGGTGLTAIDYRLTDAFMDPPGTSDALYVEKSVRLPDCWCCYDPLCQPPPIGQPPVATRGHITFGALNNFCKMNEEVLDLWSRVFAAVPNSRLLLLAKEGEHRRATCHALQIRGMAKHRIEFVRPQARQQYLRLYDRIDIALDPFPYNGITTTCDALWTGVPVVTVPGERPASRAGFGLLSTAGMPELVAASPDQFVQIAVDLASDLPHLAELRRTLRARMQASPLMDAPRFARNIEAAFRRMWQTWCETAPTTTGR